jgi:hypothetical protein
MAPAQSLVLLLAATTADLAAAAVVGGGGGRAGDCVAVFDVPAANVPAPPRRARRVDCVDGDPACDADGRRDARCVFDLRLCVNSTALPACTPARTGSLVVDHAVDDGDPRFDADFQALQQRVATLGLPGNEDPDACAPASTLTVVLPAARRGDGRRAASKTVRLTAVGSAGGRTVRDRDRMRFTCRPEGDGRYAPRELYAGTFERIAQEVFAPSCARSGCHDSESGQGGLVLLPNAAYSTLVGVAPANPAAAAAGLLRVAPGDPAGSLLHRKLTGDLAAGWGAPMPASGPAVAPALVELIRLWILGDAALGPAPREGWVAGTDG